MSLVMGQETINFVAMMTRVMVSTTISDAIITPPNLCQERTHSIAM